MHKKRNNLNKYLIQAASADDVVHNHAFSKVAKDSTAIPTRRTSSGQGKVADYKASMVGSISQYRERAPEPTKTSEVNTGTVSENTATGNRQSAALQDKSKTDPSIERRHHFIEPPKRGFNRFG